MNPFTQDIYTEEKFFNIILDSEVIQNINFENCMFSGCRFISCTFKNCKFINCIFIKSDISATKIVESIFLDVQFNESRAMSIDWTVAGATILHLAISFHKSTINYSSFSGLALKKLQVVGCIAHEVDFIDCDLESANFCETDLKGAIFSNCDLKRSNFIKAINYAINPMDNRIKNAKFSLPDAVVLLKPFQITIEDEYGEKVLDV